MTPDEMRLHLMDKGATKPAIPKHERKANLDKFMADSKAPKLYHGTMQDIHKFDRLFTTKFRKPSIDTIGNWFSTNPGKGGAEMYAGGNEDSAIYPVHVSIKNPQKTTFNLMLRRARLLANGVDDGRMIGKPEVDAYRQWLSDRGQDGIVIRHDPHSPGGNEFKEQDAWVALHPNQIKSAIGNRGTYDPKEDDIGKADGGAINAEPLGEDTVKWTSPLADTVNSHKLGSMSGEQWMKWLHANAPRNAKKEAHASGTFDWLPQQANASKEAIVKHMKANAPQIKTTKFVDNPNPKSKARFEELRNEGEVRRLTSSERDEIEDLEQQLEDTPKTKFDEHVLPGGKNYREMTLSHSNPTGDDYIVPAGHSYSDIWESNIGNDADINRILHMRMNDMPFTYYPDKKALNLEELQSDWAQRGRSEGFSKPPPKERLARMYELEKKPVDQMSDTERAQLHDIRRLISSKKNKGLPAGPYVTDTEDWTRLGLLHAIKEAAEKGHHAVTWTNGDEQAKRWSNEGLKHYYDTVMPSVTNDILKKMGVKERVGKHFLGHHTTGINTHHGFHMTPEIVAHIKKHGLPRFASGGDISKLKAYMLNKQGTHGAQRVERAADEVPNLENMYDLRALRSAFGDDKKSAVAVINPADFEKYSSPLSSSGAPQSEIDATVKYLRSVGKFSDVPYLNLHKPDIGEPIIPGYEEILKKRRTPRIAGHQGRHRSQALTDNGEKSSLVRVSPVWELKKHLKSKTHEEYLDALHKEMAKTDHMVRPETYEVDGTDRGRPAIALPKMFASGGRSSGGDIKKMRDYIANAHGKYEGHRFERASDEVPHLLESYDPDAVKKLFGSGDVARALMTMNPADFEKYSKQLPDQNSVHAMASVHRGETGENDPWGFKGTREEYLAHLHNIKKFSSIPYLGVNKGEQGSTESTPWISEHEGRHRNRVLANRGHKTSLVEFVPRATLREPFEPVDRDKYINDIKKEMALMNNRVRPQEMTDQSGNNVRRKIIQLPELFKSGGMAHMASGGRSVEALDRESDEVPIEKRVRDALDKIHLNASGGKDTYGTGAGGRLAVDFPISKSLTLSPYLEGSAYKPKDQPTSSQINGAGISLTKRFAEGGKAKFLQPSAEKGVMYHATMHDFNKFRNNHRGMHFVTPDIGFANNHLHGQQDHDDPLDSGENIMPVHVQVTNPFDYAKLSHVKNLFRQAKKQKSPLSWGQRTGVLGGSWSILEHPDIVKAVKRLGHDAMYVSEESGEGDGLDSKNLGVFDPRKIKSAIGNRGTYDTNEHDITKSQGGLAHAFAEGGPVDVPKNIWKEYLKVKNVEKDNADEGHDNQWQKMRNTKSFKRLDNAIKAHIGGNDRQQLEYHWKLQDHYNKEHGE